MLVVILLITAFVAACSDKDADNGVVLPPPDGGNNGGNGGNDGDGTLPEPYYTRITENGTEYVYFGHAADEAAGADLNRVLVNLRESGMLSADEEGYYLYGGKKYVSCLANAAAAGRKLHDGTVIEAGKEYFFEYSPIKWRILEITDGVALLLAENVLGAAVYNPTGSFATSTGLLVNGAKANDYSSSYLKSYLNGEFRDSLFTEYERSYMCGGEEAVGLLSIQEIDKYALYAEKGYMVTVSPTEYLVADGIDVKLASGGEQYYASWWLSDRGSDDALVMFVDAMGRYGDIYEDAASATHGLRPVIALRL